jgi:ribosome maturation factor RimP
MDLKTQVEQIVESLLEENYFLVDLQIGGTSQRPKINIFLDGDAGISIDYCAEISRKAGKILDEKIEAAYILEVSSPGIDAPLKFIRQYKKNIGRKVKIQLSNQTEMTGTLTAVSENQIEIMPKKKKKIKTNRLRKLFYLQTLPAYK